MKISNYFPTTIFTEYLDSAIVPDLNNELLKKIRASRAMDEKALAGSNYTQFATWQSHAMLHENPDYSSILDFFHKCGEFISETSGYDNRYALKVRTMRSIINPVGTTNTAHIHPGSLLSGVYFVQTPAYCGNISFTDPRTANIMHAPNYAENQPRQRDTKTKINITPEAGKIVIFPSWLYHSMAPNMAQETGLDGERVTIIFNISQVAK